MLFCITYDILYECYYMNNTEINYIRALNNLKNYLRRYSSSLRKSACIFLIIIYIKNDVTVIILCLKFAPVSIFAQNTP